MRTLLRTRIRPMAADDVAQISDIERESFTSIWPEAAYQRELGNKLARYLVIVEQPPAPGAPPHPPRLFGALRRMVGSAEGTAQPGERVIGFIGLWLMVGEAHIVTVAVRERFRRMGIGERLLIAALEMARGYEQEVVTLEVRKSNEAAQRMYEKYGFDRVGLRVRYYTDNNEDAVIMTTPDLESDAYRLLVESLTERHRARYPDLWE